MREALDRFKFQNVSEATQAYEALKVFKTAKIFGVEKVVKIS